MVATDGIVWYDIGMVHNHKPCPLCGQPMNRQSKRCRACYIALGPTVEVRQRLSEQRKGKPSYERTEKHRQKLSQALAGRKKSWQAGDLNISHRPEVQQKVQDYWTPERREVKRQEMLEKAKDRKWRLRCGRPGMLNANFRHGESFVPYTPGWNDLVRQQVKERANGVCEHCGASDDLHVHHRDLRKEKHDLKNLLLLCRKCHFLLHRRKNPPAQ